MEIKYSVLLSGSVIDSCLLHDWKWPSSFPSVDCPHFCLTDLLCNLYVYVMHLILFLNVTWVYLSGLKASYSVRSYPYLGHPGSGSLSLELKFEKLLWLYRLEKFEIIVQYYDLQLSL